MDHPQHTIDYYWKKIGFKPNQKQEAAIRHTNGPLFLSAGPGSGKTRVLLWRTLNLIVYEGIDPRDIILSTFTEKAAKQLKDGLHTYLGLVTNETGKSYDIASMPIGTIHSLCRKFLVDRRLSEGRERKRAPILLDELAQYFRIYSKRNWLELIQAGGYSESEEETAQREINMILMGKDIYSRHVAVKSLISFFNRLSEEGIEPGELHLKDQSFQFLVDMYQKYLLDLSSGGKVPLVDFSILQKVTFDFLQMSDSSKDVFRHVIIDEYQDTNYIQERIFFHLAGGSKNICVVGDDDQSLYRFRGATVENLVEFEKRVKKHLGVKATRIDLSENYRSRSEIVDFYINFIETIDWENPLKKKEYFRIMDKGIKPNRIDKNPAVFTTERKSADLVYQEIAELILKLKKEEVISDLNQVALLFPAMKGWGGEKNTRVNGFINAFQNLGIPYYAPRAGRFLEVEEAISVFGVIQKVIGSPGHGFRGNTSSGFRNFQDWMKGCAERADLIIDEDPNLSHFVELRKKQVKTARTDYENLLEFCSSNKLSLTDSVPQGLALKMSAIQSISSVCKTSLLSHSLNVLIKKRIEERNPVSVRYLINRVTALDWTLLDLFYQIIGFGFFKEMIDLAENGADEGPVCNLSMISQYISRFLEERISIITGQSLEENRLSNLFFSSFLYAIFRLGESEYENADDPFPKGRVPFLTIHQSKGLEFPVVVLGSVFQGEKEPSSVEVFVRDELKRGNEPLERISLFDKMRTFYVGLSRAENLLILPRYTRNSAATPEFESFFSQGKLKTISELQMNKIPKAKENKDKIPGVYSYTSDYLHYQNCPRNYMIFRKYGFVPSRSQSMFFGKLIHETVEDLHNFVMDERDSK
jgi:DNA helicase II / ATP-dependent DNA helicase PcrA